MPLDLRATTAFDVLQAAIGRPDEYTLRGSGAKTSNGEILFALDGEGKRHLLIPAGDSRVAEDTQSAGVQIRETTLVIEGTDTAYADVVCERPALNDVFYMFVEDVLDGAEGASHPTAVARATLDRWRELLESFGGGLLSKRRVAGIVAELLILQFVAENVDDLSVSAWTGPTGHRHDLVIPGASIEVKSTLSTDDRVVTVHGLRQLMALPGKELFLVLVRLISDPEGSLNLPDLLDQLALEGFAAQELNSRTSSLGVDPSDYDRYRAISFSLESIEVYTPEDNGFPRLTLSSLTHDLPPGVDDLTYTVDLDVVQEQAMSQQEFKVLLQKLDGTL